MERTYTERKFWDGFAGRYDSFIKRLQPTYDLIIQKVRETIDPSQDILEIATGTGIISLAIADNAHTVTGCDISPEMIKVAQKKLEESHLNNVSFSVEDAYHLGFEGAAYNVAIASNTLHVMMNPGQALRSVHRVLKPGGILIAPTYCHGNSFFTRMVSSIMSIVGFRAHQKWSTGSFKEFIQSHEFDIVTFEIIDDLIPLVFAVARKK